MGLISQSESCVIDTLLYLRQTTKKIDKFSVRLTRRTSFACTFLLRTNRTPFFWRILFSITWGVTTVNGFIMNSKYTIRYILAPETTQVPVPTSLITKLRRIKEFICNSQDGKAVAEIYMTKGKNKHKLCSSDSRREGKQKHNTKPTPSPIPHTLCNPT